MRRTERPHRARVTARAVAIAAACGIALGAPSLSAMAAPHHQTAPTAAPLEFVSLDTASQTVTSSKHQKLVASLYADYEVSEWGACDPSVQEDQIGFSISLTAKSKGGSDEHSWSGSLPCRDLTYTKGGTARLTIPSKQFGPLGSLSLTFHKTKTGSVTGCGSQDDKGRLAGHMTFKAKGRWGTVGSSHFSFSKAYLEYGYPAKPGKCHSTGPSTPRCPAHPLDSLEVIHGVLQMYGSDTGYPTSASREVSLSKPSGFTRSDYVTLTSHPHFKKVGKQELATLGSSGNLASGSATLKTKGKSATYDYGQCRKRNGKKVMEKSRYWTKATFKDHKLAFHPAIGGPITFPPSKKQDYVVSRISSYPVPLRSRRPPPTGWWAADARGARGRSKSAWSTA